MLFFVLNCFICLFTFSKYKVVVFKRNIFHYNKQQTEIFTHSIMDFPLASTRSKRSVAQDLILRKYSPASFELPKHVVIVMDGLKEPSLALLEWVLKNVAVETHCTVTLLRVMPWLTFPCQYNKDFRHDSSLC